MRKLISIILFVTVVLTVGNPVNPVNVRALEEVTFPMPLICIDFENMQHTTPFAEIKDAVYGEETQSCHKFWNLVTDGKISVVPGDYDGLEWARAPEPIEYYATKGETWADERIGELITWGLEKAVQDGFVFDGKIINNTYLPYVCVVVSGIQEGEHNTPVSNGFWPRVGGALFNQNGELMRIGYILIVDDPNGRAPLSMVLAHEFGHRIMLGDLYDNECGTGDKPTEDCDFPLTYYDIMVSRNKGVGLSSYHRIKLGLVEPMLITESTELTIPLLTSNEYGSILKIPFEGTDEYLLIEYRRKIDEDSFWEGIPKEGILIYRVNESFPHYGYINNGKNRPFGVELLNPGGNIWHDDACYTSTGYNVAGPNTNPSTLPNDNRYLSTATITMLGEDENSSTIKVDIEKIKLVDVSPRQSSMKVGHLHRTGYDFTISNDGVNTRKIKNKYMRPDEIILEPGESSTVKIELFTPKDQIKGRVINREILFEIDQYNLFLEVELKNLLFEIDINGDRKIDTSDISIISSSDYDERFDVNLDGLIDAEDMVIIAKYIGIRY
ncbi:MAG TPA: hypothetical protein PKV16_07315 [Caldisericia bacterium]|nr:hypothetical protein [Caldisericia bacterium]HPF49404.1 hypothetical protein [Caldisericia bacterium]HPI84393.1 hypothetical protein [Caldisericia bacterium]HPQ93575.1 hypothetical protein [Caldisericia bacterium]HRV75544.1 hypothetical protein [Caldisericia bacterium]